MSKFIPNAFQVPNVIVDEYIDKLHAHSFKLLIFIIRKTKGWNKTRDAIATTQLAKVMGVKMIRKVYPYIKELEDLGLIKVYKSTGKTNQYSLGKNFDKPVPKKDSTQKGTSTQKEHIPVPKKNTGTSTQKEHSTKDTIKTTSIKEVKNDLTLQFWTNYPRKIKKKQALQIFKKLSNKKQLLIIDDCKVRYIETETQYIPHPTTYLNGELFLDELEQPAEANQWSHVL
jgi:hypothetical protein